MFVNIGLLTGWSMRLASPFISGSSGASLVGWWGSTYVSFLESMFKMLNVL